MIPALTNTYLIECIPFYWNLIIKKILSSNSIPVKMNESLMLLYATQCNSFYLENFKVTTNKSWCFSKKLVVMFFGDRFEFLACMCSWYWTKKKLWTICVYQQKWHLIGWNVNRKNRDSRAKVEHESLQVNNLLNKNKVRNSFGSSSCCRCYTASSEFFL